MSLGHRVEGGLENWPIGASTGTPTCAYLKHILDFPYLCLDIALCIGIEGRPETHIILVSICVADGNISGQGSPTEDLRGNVMH